MCASDRRCNLENKQSFCETHWLQSLYLAIPFSLVQISCVFEVTVSEEFRRVVEDPLADSRGGLGPRVQCLLDIVLSPLKKVLRSGAVALPLVPVIQKEEGEGSLEPRTWSLACC